MRNRKSTNMGEGKIKLLILDDEKGIVDYSRKVFELKGFEVFTASTAEEAISIYEKERPDINLIDVYLIDSKMDGIEVLGAIKAMNADAVCVIISRVTDREKIEKAEQLGAFHYLLKPLDLQKLVSVVQDAAAVVKGRV